MSAFKNNTNREPSEVLEEVVTSTLEDWAMMLTEAATPDSFSPETLDHIYYTTIVLNGPYSGSIHILATKEFAETLHQNLAGDFETEISESDVVDCLKEMANVTAGRVITEVFGENAVFDLTDLTCKRCELNELEKFNTEENSIYILGDDCPVGFSLNL